MPRGDPKDEYKDLSDNMRNYVNVRFAQLTLFVAITAALVTIAFTSEPPVSDSMRFVLKIGGVIRPWYLRSWRSGRLITGITIDGGPLSWKENWATSSIRQGQHDVS